MVLIMSIIFLYLMFVMFLGVFGRVKKCDDLNFYKANGDVWFVIPAHNEQQCIGNTIQAVKDNIRVCRLNIKIWVVADRCSDNTVKIARECGANIFLRNYGKPGKQFALSDFFNTMNKYIGDNDIVSILDADNIINLDYIMQMVKGHNKGNEIQQGYIATKNINDNFQTSWYALNYFYMFRALYWGREMLKRCAVLGGTGWSCLGKVMKAVPFYTTSLTDDLEYTLQLRKRGYRVAFNPYMITYDEKPVGFIQGLKQRLRWSRGQWQCLFKYWSIFFKDMEIMVILLIPAAQFFYVFLIFTYGVTLNGLLVWLSLYFFMTLFDGRGRGSVGLVLVIPYMFIQLILNVVGFITFYRKTWIRTEHVGGNLR